MSFSWIIPGRGMVKMPDDYNGWFVPGHGMLTPVWTGIILPASMALPYWGDIVQYGEDRVFRTMFIDVPIFGNPRIKFAPITDPGFYAVTFGEPVVAITSSNRTIYPEGWLVPIFGANPLVVPHRVSMPTWFVPIFGTPTVGEYPKMTHPFGRGMGGMIWVGDHIEVTQMRDYVLEVGGEPFDVSTIGTRWQSGSRKDIGWTLTIHSYIDMDAPGQRLIYDNIIKQGDQGRFNVAIRIAEDYIFEGQGVLTRMSPMDKGNNSVIEVEIVISGTKDPVLSTAVRKRFKVTQMYNQIEFQNERQMRAIQMYNQVEYQNEKKIQLHQIYLQVEYSN